MKTKPIIQYFCLSAAPKIFDEKDKKKAKEDIQRQKEIEKCT